jgi:hypothetical protein
MKRRRWQRVPGFDDIEAARDELAKVQGKTRKGEKTPPADATFAGVRNRYLASRRFAKLGAWTQKNFRASLETEEALLELGPLKIAAIDADVLGHLVGELERREKKHGTGKLRQSSVENILKPVRAVLAYAVKEKLLSASPSRRSRRRIARRPTRSRTSRTSGRTPSSNACSPPPTSAPPSRRAATTTRRS